MLGAQSTERSPSPRRRGAHIERYLFVVLEGARLEAGGLRVPLAGVESLRIGRGPARALVPEHSATQALEVPDSRMSGTHARIVRTDAELVIEDAGSKNGTRVNGQRIAAHALCDGDLVELGQTILLYRELEDAGRGRSLDSSETAGLEPGFATLDPNLATRLERLARVAPSRLSILLLGETGTGKELLAQGLHVLSRRPGPFVAVNCGAIPPNLVEAQLFGHVRGAFSGALKDEPGLVRSAHGGTLLLDEIGDLPASSQTALLRVLQEGEVRPVGSTQVAKVDVRIVAATHMPLAELIERGAFRRDLYARLAGYTFALAPLRERRMDLGLVVAALLAAGKLGPRSGVRVRGDAGRALVGHDWPMNVRELEQCLHAACILAEDGEITADDLPPAVVGSPAAAAPSARGHPEQSADRERVVRALADCAGNQTRAARQLGISRTTLITKLRIYQIARPSK